MNKICCENDVFFVNDLIYGNKILFTYEEFMDHYNIRLNLITFHLYVKTFQQHLSVDTIFQWFLSWFPWERVAANKEATEPRVPLG
jgi:hypothetical protein